jgi:hypothetical protein
MFSNEMGLTHNQVFRLELSMLKFMKTIFMLCNDLLGDIEFVSCERESASISQQHLLDLVIYCPKHGSTSGARPHTDCLNYNDTIERSLTV